MTEFRFHDVTSAPSAAKPVLDSLQKKFGFMPGLYAGLAESPAALQQYLDGSDAFAKTSLSPAEQQVVLLAVSVENGCEFCVGAHSFIARQMIKLPSPVVDALRSRLPLPDPRLDSLATFTREIVRERGWVSNLDVEAFLAAGFTRAQVLEVIMGVSLKTLSNYANHILATPLNKEFAAEAWRRAD